MHYVWLHLLQLLFFTKKKNFAETIASVTLLFIEDEDSLILINGSYSRFIF